MMNLFSDGMRFLEESLGELAVPVVYRRGGRDVEIQAVRGGTSWHDISRDNGTGIDESNRDYIFKSKDFLELGEPVAKDKIVDQGDVWTVYNMFGERCWRYCDPAKTLIRVHCKR